VPACCAADAAATAHSTRAVSILDIAPPLGGWSNTAMSEGSDVRCFAARMSVLPEILGCVREACRKAGIIPPAALRAELVIEELFTNTVRHGYKGECDHPVWLHARPAPGALYLTYQDAAEAFDP